MRASPPARAALNLTTGSDTFVNDASVTNGGSITLRNGASWSQSGGSESGASPVTLFGGALSDSGTGSSGAFEFIDNVGLSGTIAAARRSRFTR